MTDDVASVPLSLAPSLSRQFSLWHCKSARGEQTHAGLLAARRQLGRPLLPVASPRFKEGKVTSVWSQFSSRYRRPFAHGLYLLVQWSFPRVFIVLLARTLGRPFQRPCDAFAARRTLSQRGGGSRPSVASDAVDSRISWRRSDKEETEGTVFGMALGRAVPPPRARRGSRR